MMPTYERFGVGAAVPSIGPGCIFSCSSDAARTTDILLSRTTCCRSCLNVCTAVTDPSSSGSFGFILGTTIGAGAALTASFFWAISARVSLPSTVSNDFTSMTCFFSCASPLSRLSGSFASCRIFAMSFFSSCCSAAVGMGEAGAAACTGSGTPALFPGGGVLASGCERFSCSMIVSAC